MLSIGGAHDVLLFYDLATPFRSLHAHFLYRRKKRKDIRKLCNLYECEVCGKKQLRSELEPNKQNSQSPFKVENFVLDFVMPYECLGSIAYTYPNLDYYKLKLLQITANSKHIK